LNTHFRRPRSIFGIDGLQALHLAMKLAGAKLIAWLQEAISSRQKTTISDCPGTVVQAGLHVELLRTRDDTGIVRTAEGTFVWQRSEEG
jgi:hypothetical protein